VPASEGSLAAPGPASATLVASPAHDFGRVTQGDTLRHAFEMHNRTGAPASVETTREVLGCRGVAVPAVLAPDQRGTLDVTCRANVHGPLRVSLPLRAFGHPAGELSLRAEVEPLLVFDRPMLEMSVPFGRSHEAEARLRGKHAKTARLSLARAAPPGMDVRLLPPTATQTGGALLRLVRPAAGVHAGSLHFFTGLAEPAALELAYSVKVTGTLSLSPTNPVLDLAAPGGARSLVQVSSTQPGFRVERAVVLEGPFSARVHETGGAWSVEVSLVTAEFPPAAHGANGRLRIVSNDRTEPSKEIPLFALGKPPRPSGPPSTSLERPSQ
jgi:hypothetical protein